MPLENSVAFVFEYQAKCRFHCTIIDDSAIFGSIFDKLLSSLTI